MAQPSSRVDDGAENRLEAFGARDSSEHLADCALLFELALDRVQQPRVRDRDRCLAGKGGDEPDLIVGERLGDRPRHGEDPNQLFVGKDRHADHRAVACDALRSPLVRGIGAHVGDVHEPARGEDATGERVRLGNVRMRALVLGSARAWRSEPRRGRARRPRARAPRRRRCKAGSPPRRRHRGRAAGLRTSQGRPALRQPPAVARAAARAALELGRAHCGRLERRHRQAEPSELLPVELRPLAVSAPDDRAAAVVDPVGEAQPLSKSTPGIVAESANATPSNVLWLSLSTITFHGLPAAVPVVGWARQRLSHAASRRGSCAAKASCRPPALRAARRRCRSARRARRASGSSRG